MWPLETLPLLHSWPLLERGLRFDLGMLDGGDGMRPIDLPSGVLARPGVGAWECDLRDHNRLTWSAGVYDLFGLPRDATVSREETASLYGERSRATMERLRAYAIKHRRGFTLDAEILPAQGGRRWMRLVAAPICVEGAVVRLHGLKTDVTSEYP